MSAVLLRWSWVSEGSQSLHFVLKISVIYHLHTQYSIFFFFGNCPSLIYNLASVHLFWCSVCLICTTFILYPSLIPLGENLSAAFDPTYIFISCGRPQCSSGNQLQVWSQCSGQGQWQDSERLMDHIFAMYYIFIENYLFLMFFAN